MRLGLHPAPGMCRLTVGMVVEGGMMFGRGHRADIVEECAFLLTLYHSMVSLTPAHLPIVVVSITGVTLGTEGRALFAPDLGGCILPVPFGTAI